MSARARPFKFRDGWRVQYEDIDGKRHWKSFDRHGDAERWLIDRQAQVARIQAGAEARPIEPRLFDELCTFWLENKAPTKRSEKDDRSIIEAHLRPCFGGLKLIDVTVERALAYRRGRRHLAEKTIHNHLTMLLSMLHLAEEMGWLSKVPRIKKPRLVEEEYAWLKTSAAIQALLTAAADEPPGVLELYATAVYTGMRAGELLGLRWDDVDLERRAISVKRSYDKPTKTGAIRHVPILDPLLPVLRAWKVRCWSSEWVFPSIKGTMQCAGARALQEVLRACQERLEVAEADRITFHDLRHTFASHWMMGGGDLFRLQRVLGHKSIQMTQRYAHLAPDVYKQDYDRLVDAVPKVREAQVTECGVAPRRRMRKAEEVPEDTRSGQPGVCARSPGRPARRGPGRP